MNQNSSPIIMPFVEPRRFLKNTGIEEYEIYKSKLHDITFYEENIIKNQVGSP